MLSALTNPSLGFARQAYNAASRAVERSMERLATGQKLNRASDDPSGLTGAEKMRSTEKLLAQRVESIDLESAMLGAREGASSVIADSLIDLQGLLTRFANSGSLSDKERDGIQNEVNAVLESIDFTAATAMFRGQQLIEGRNTSRLGMGVVLLKPDAQDSLSPSSPGPGGITPGQIPSPREVQTPVVATLASLGGNGLSTLGIEDAQKILTAAISDMSGDRAAIGNRMLDLDSQRRATLVELENTAAARSAITDTDIGEETAALVRAKLMQDASLYTQQMAARRQSEAVLDLLQSAAAPPVNVRIQLT